MRPRVRIAAIVLLPLGLTSCLPWTVRPIDGGAGKEQASGSSPAASPAAYADSIWDTKLLPAVANTAVDARVLLDALAASPAEARTRYGRREGNGPWHFLVKGEGVVTAVDARSRVGLALVDIAPFDKRPDLSVQIGPVLRGNALRDATGMVRFTDFVNQLQFADAANELNERALKTVLAPLDKAKLKGRKVSFAGALAAQEKSDLPLPELVPVRLTMEERR